MPEGYLLELGRRYLSGRLGGRHFDVVDNGCVSNVLLERVDGVDTYSGLVDVSLGGRDRCLCRIVCQQLIQK